VVGGKGVEGECVFLGLFAERFHGLLDSLGIAANSADLRGVGERLKMIGKTMEQAAL
jgi:hypothetical protein